jgi:hypothetical protein
VPTSEERRGEERRGEERRGEERRGASYEANIKCVMRLLPVSLGCVSDIAVNDTTAAVNDRRQV